MVTARGIAKALERVHRRLRLLASRAVVDGSAERKLRSLRVKLLADEVHDDVEHFEAYGLSGRPPAGSEGLFIAVGGDRTHGVVVSASSRAHRPTDLEAGEVCLYAEHGQRIYLRENGDVQVIPAAGGKVHLGAGSGAQAVALADDVKSRLDTLQAAFDSHTHVTTATIGASATPGVIAPTAAPVGALAPVGASKVDAT